MDLECVLQGVVAYVEVRSSNDNRSAAICQALRQLGARVKPSFSDDVTHVVYKEGMKRTWNKAVKRGIPLVAVHWIDSCKQNKKCMPVKDFPAILPEENNSPILKLNQNTRWKKMKSMQPCDFDEELARSAERNEQRRKRVMMANRFKLAEEATPSSIPAPILALETQYRSPLYLPLTKPCSPVPDTPPSLKERLERMRREQKLLLGTEEESPTGTPKPQVDKPLQRRLFDKLASGLSSLEDSNDEDDASHVVAKLIQSLESDSSQESSGKDRPTSPTDQPEEKICKASDISSPVTESLSNGAVISSAKKRRSLRTSKLFQISPDKSGQDRVKEDQWGSDINSLKQTSSKSRMTSENRNGDVTKQTLLKSKVTSENDYVLKQVSSKSDMSSKNENRDGLKQSSSKSSCTTEHENCKLIAQNDEVLKSHKDKSTSRALSPRDVNVDLCEVNGHANMRTEMVTSKKGDSTENAQIQCQVSEDGNRELSLPGKSQDLGPQEGLMPQHGESKNNRPTNSSACSLKAKLTKKKRNLFTESAVPMLLDPLNKDAQKTSPEAPPSCKSAGKAATVLTAKSEVSFLFGSSAPRDVQVEEKHTRRKSRRLSSMPCKGGEVRSETESGNKPNEKRSSKCGSALTAGKSDTSRKKDVSCLGDSVLKNDTLGSSMSVMYGNDTALAKSSIVDARRSIDEFSANITKAKWAHRPTTNGESNARTDGNIQRKRNNKSTQEKGKQCRQKKRSRSSSESSTSTTTSTDKPESKRQKGSRSYPKTADELLNTSSAAQQVDVAPLRLRHARSLVMEQTILTYSKRSPYSLVMTSLHRDEQELVYSVVRKLGVFHMTNNVESSTTHVVCGEPRRTLNVLKAVARGCWLLRKEWVLESLEAGAWLLEEDFEMHEFPSAKKSRLGRQSTGGTGYKLDLFSKLGPIFVSSATSPARQELVHLINLCCGHVTGSEQRAAVHVGDEHNPLKFVVKPTWILDSVMNMQVLPAENYIVPSPASQSQREDSPEF